MEFSRQEYWSGLPFPSPGDLRNPGIEPGFPALQAEALPSEPPGKPTKWSTINLTPGYVLHCGRRHEAKAEANGGRVRGFVGRRRCGWWTHRAGLGPNPVQGAAGDGVDAALVLSPPCQPWVYSCSPCPEKGKAGEWPEESKIMPTTGLDKTSLRFIRPTESLGRTHLGRFQP